MSVCCQRGWGVTHILGAPRGTRKSGRLLAAPLSSRPLYCSRSCCCRRLKSHRPSCCSGRSPRKILRPPCCCRVYFSIRSPCGWYAKRGNKTNCRMVGPHVLRSTVVCYPGQRGERQRRGRMPGKERAKKGNSYLVEHFLSDFSHFTRRLHVLMYYCSSLSPTTPVSNHTTRCPYSSCLADQAGRLCSRVWLAWRGWHVDLSQATSGVNISYAS